MTTLAHISDIHLAPLPPLTLRELASKRITGYINWRLNRSRFMKRDTMSALIAHLKTQDPDLIAVSGDLVNLGSEAEFELTGQWLERLGTVEKVAVIPGNHDAYVAKSLSMARRRWGGYMLGQSIDRAPFPFVRRIGNIALMGCNSAVPQPPFIAAGEFDSAQADRLARGLAALKTAGYFRVVMIHHPPTDEFARSRSKGMRGANLFRDAIAQSGAELILHGHLHHSTMGALDGPDGEVPVIGVASASADASQGEQPARYNLFSVEKTDRGWTCDFAEYGYQRIGDEIVLRLHQRLY